MYVVTLREMGGGRLKGVGHLIEVGALFHPLSCDKKMARVRQADGSTNFNLI